MLDTILLFMFVLFSVLGVFIFSVFILLKASAPKGNEQFFLVALPSGKEKEYLLKIKWLEGVLAVTGLADRITLIAVDENTEENGISELEAAFSDRKNIVILKNR